MEALSLRRALRHCCDQLTREPLPCVRHFARRCLQHDCCVGIDGAQRRQPGCLCVETLNRAYHLDRPSLQSGRVRNGDRYHAELRVRHVADFARLVSCSGGCLCAPVGGLLSCLLLALRLELHEPLHLVVCSIRISCLYDSKLAFLFESALERADRASHLFDVVSWLISCVGLAWFGL